MLYHEYSTFYSIVSSVNAIPQSVTHSFFIFLLQIIPVNETIFRLLSIDAFVSINFNGDALRQPFIIRGFICKENRTCFWLLYYCEYNNIICYNNWNHRKWKQSCWTKRAKIERKKRVYFYTPYIVIHVRNRHRLINCIQANHSFFFRYRVWMDILRIFTPNFYRGHENHVCASVS